MYKYPVKFDGILSYLNYNWNLNLHNTSIALRCDIAWISFFLNFHVLTYWEGGQKEYCIKTKYIFLYLVSWYRYSITFVYFLVTGLVWFFHRIGDVMVSVLESSSVDREFELRSGQTKDYEIGICFFCVLHATLRCKSKAWLTRNQDNVSEWSGSDISTRGLLFQWANTI
jgi:hypothetical protein